MTTNYDVSSLLTLASGDQTAEQSVTRTVNFDRYEIGVKLTTSGMFLGIVSIKVRKSFIESVKNMQTSDVHDVDRYYNEEE